MLKLKYELKVNAELLEGTNKVFKKSHLIHNLNCSTVNECFSYMYKVPSL